MLDFGDMVKPPSSFQALPPRATSFGDSGFGVGIEFSLRVFEFMGFLAGLSKARICGLR